MYEYLRPDMEVLVNIGEEAVPMICEAFVHAKTEAAALPRYSRAGITEEEKRIGVECRIQRSQARFAMVLGEIGDPRALPVLEDFLRNQAEKTYASSYVEYAIVQIRSKHQMK